MSKDAEMNAAIYKDLEHDPENRTLQERIDRKREIVQKVEHQPVVLSDEYGMFTWNSRVLTCPFCGQGWLHPSDVSGDTEIAFWCESCDAIPQLNIVFHKGNTYLYWTVRGET